MQSNEMNMIMKIFGILGMVFCLIALLAPWGNGIFTFGIFAEGYSTPFGIDLFTNQFYQEILGAGQVIFFAIAIIIIFVLTLVALLLSILTVRNIQSSPPGRSLVIGILLIVSFIMYIIAVSVLSGGSGTFGAYGAGFVMALIGAILFFIIYGLQKFYLTAPSPAMYQQQMYQQPAYNQPQAQYYAHQQPPQQAPPVQEQYTQVPPQQQPPAQPAPRARRQQPQAAPKFCQECGSPITPNSKFCSGCGNKLI